MTKRKTTTLIVVPGTTANLAVNTVLSRIKANYK